MCKCTPNMRTPFCGKPGCEWPSSWPTKYSMIDIPREILDAAMKLKRWAAERDWRNWTVMGIGPRPAVSSRPSDLSSNQIAVDTVHDVVAALESARGDDILKNRAQMLTVVQRLHRREYVMAQSIETGRYWSGPREEIPPRFAEVPERAEGGLAHEPSATPMGHEDAQSRIIAAVHEVQVLCAAFGYDPNEWLRADDDRPAGNAWLVADSGSQGEHRFRTLRQGMSAWTLNPNEALQFSRRSDAERWAAEDEDAWHIFPVPGSAEPPAETYGIPEVLAYLNERADWLRKEWQNGGDYSYLHLKEEECRYIAKCIKDTSDRLRGGAGGG